MKRRLNTTQSCPERAPATGHTVPGLLTGMLAGLVVLGAAAAEAAAQEPVPSGVPVPALFPSLEATAGDSIELVDWVVAAVGDTALLWSEVLEALIQMNAQGVELPPAGTAAFDSVVNETTLTLVEQLMLLQKAKETDTDIPAETIDGETDRRFREIRNSFPSATAFEEAIQRSGRNLVQYREFLRNQVRAQVLIDAFVQQSRDQLPPVSVSEEEIQAWFEERLAGEERPAAVTFEQLVVEPEAAPEAADSARTIAETALAEIRDGTDFAIVARRYSQDFANREQGGDLGWVRRSMLVPEFARAAWTARTGEPIGPIKTRFGFHIIKVENVRGGERKIRHILIQPPMNEADFRRAEDKAAALADSVRRGVSLPELAERHGLPEIPVRIPDVPLDEIGTRLGPAYEQALSRPIPGEVVEPFSTEGLLPDRPVYIVLRVLEFRELGAWNLDDVREQVRDNLLFEKGYRRFIEELKNEIYVDVRL